MEAVTVEDIQSFEDIEGFCQESYPCQHGPFKIVLKDKRTVSADLGPNDIYSILKGLKDIGVENPNWNHFSGYANLGKRGWTIRPANEILTKVFKNSQPPGSPPPLTLSSKN